MRKYAPMSARLGVVGAATPIACMMPRIAGPPKDVAPELEEAGRGVPPVTSEWAGFIQGVPLVKWFTLSVDGTAAW